ncbi:MAG: copper resistance protein CopC [Halobacteria archaeon]
MIPARLLLVALVAAGVFAAGCTQAPTTAPAATPGGVMEQKEGEVMKKEAPAMEKKEGAAMMKVDEIKAPHFVRSEPAHGSVQAQAPAKIVVYADFNLHEISKIQVVKDGSDATGGPTIVASDRLSMSAPVKSAGNGTYIVNYTACWPDRSCHEGRFVFNVGEARMEKKEGAMMETKNESGAMREKKNESGALMEKKEGAMMEKGPGLQIKSPHFVDSVPGHGGVYAKPPARVLLNFDFDLHPKSSITVTRDGADATGGPTVVGANKLSMSAPVKDLSGGTYVVNYSACWPDGSCHPGQFSFTVNGSSLAGYRDLRSRSSVTVSMKSIAFSPEKIRVSPGTKVVFVNDDPVEHFVNTDPHPSHNDLPSLNSRGLAQGATYEYTFNEKGEYHYHCSAHYLGLARPMVGVVLVE